jgi:hypothetical protein
MADELSVYFCTACGAPHNNPKTITTCAVCNRSGTVKVRPAFAAEEKPERICCEVCGGNHATRDSTGNLCGNGMEGGVFSAPSDTKQARCA